MTFACPSCCFHLPVFLAVQYYICTQLALPQHAELPYPCSFPPCPHPRPRSCLQLRTAQQWRWALLRALHQDEESSQPGALAAHYEPLLFSWMRLRKAVAALLATVAVAVAEGSSGELSYLLGRCYRMPACCFAC